MHAPPIIRRPRIFPPPLVPNGNLGSESIKLPLHPFLLLSSIFHPSVHRRVSNHSPPPCRPSSFAGRLNAMRFLLCRTRAIYTRYLFRPRFNCRNRFYLLDGCSGGISNDLPAHLHRVSLYIYVRPRTPRHLDRKNIFTFQIFGKFVLTVQ